MKIRLVILMSAVAIAIAASEFTADAPPAPVAAQVPAPAVAPPMPDNEPSRRQTGGPDERLAWETMLLADPATGRIPPDIHRRERAFAARPPCGCAAVGGSVDHAPTPSPSTGARRQ